MDTEQPIDSERVSALIEELADSAGITRHAKLVRGIIATGVGLGQDETSRLNLKITDAALREMRLAFTIFDRYAGVNKATIFGSARIQAHDPLWHAAEAAARELSQRDWMVITGAGPGIMEAAATGAGSEMSFGVSIRLPFEERPSAVVATDDRHVAMKYFFTRKLMLVKESRGFICLPGGFGTMDETFELLTLQQTGKSEPVPIVLLDKPGGTFWSGFLRFVRDELEAGGLISPGDLDRVTVTDSPSEAAETILHFWSNYHSLRWHHDRLVIRLRHAPSDAQLADIRARFDGLCLSGTIEATEPLDVEVAGSDALEFPRITLIPKQRAVGDLFRLIGALNDLTARDAAATADSAPSAGRESP